MSQQTGSNTPIRLTQPDAGQTVNIAINADDMRLSLGFAPDPNAVAKNGQDLEFSFEDGGKIVLEGYYDHFTSKTLPVMVTEEGDELSGEDFLASLNEDLLTAAGPGAGAAAAGSGAGEYADDAGSLIGGVGRLGSLGTIYWDRATEVPEEYRGIEIPALGLTSGPGGNSLLSLSDYGLNESEAGFSLYLNLSFPAIGDIVVSIQVGGSATMLQNVGSDLEFLSDFSIINGPNYSYNPATGILTVTIPAGETTVEVPMNLVDDHISDMAKDITFTVIETEGPVLSATGATATVNISEDANPSNMDAVNDINEMDGPLVGLVNLTVGDNGSLISELYEGSPEGHTFTFGITLTDPRGGDYKGFTFSSGETSNELSQDMTVTLRVADGARADYGVDYEYDFSPLQVPGTTDWLPGIKNVTVSEDGTITIEFYGRVDANGNLYDPSQAFQVCDDNGVPNIPKINVQVLINGEGTGDGEGTEDFGLHVAETSGNESWPNPTAGSDVNYAITDDPKVSFVENDRTVQESDDSNTIPLTLAFDKEIGGGVEFTISLDLKGSATIWNGDPVTKFAADYIIENAVYGTDGGNITATVTFNGEDVTITFMPDGAGGYDLVVTGNGAALTENNGSWELPLEFVLNDDHIGGNAGNEGDEDIIFEISKVTLDDTYSGHNHTQGGGVGIGGNDRNEITITDDILAGDLDGPIVNVVNDGDTSVKEGQDAHLDFRIELKDPHTGQEYAGFEGDNQLSQDMTVTITVGGSATYGDDYSFDLSAIESLPGVISAVYDPATGQITLQLQGRVDANGNPHDFTDPGTEPAFDVTLELKFTANITDDKLTEANAETITFEVSTVIGNESQVGTGASGTIEGDTEANFNGPVFAISMEQTVAESGAGDAYAPYNPTDNLTHIDLTITGRTAADNAGADEGVRINLKLSGQNGAVFNPADPADNSANAPDGMDAYWADVADSWVLQIGAETYDNPVYDPNANTITFALDNGATFVISDVEFKADGSIDMTMPAGDYGANQVTVKVGVGITDDLRETETGEGLKAELTLVEKEGGLPYGEASIEQGKDTAETEIIDDPRNGELNPATHDGPWVTLGLGEMDNGTVIQGDGTVQESADANVKFMIALTDPGQAAGAGPAYGADEPVTVNLKISSEDPTFTLSDLFKPGNTGAITQTISVTFYDANGTVVGTAAVPLEGAGNNGWSTGGTFSVMLPVNAAYAEITLPINDDPLKGPNTDAPEETFTLQITGVNGNEARAEGDAQTGGPSASVTITDDDDSAGKEFDGMNIGLIWNTGPDTGVEIVEGKTYTLGLKLTNAGSGANITSNTNNPYAGYTANNALPEDTTVTMTFTNTTPGVDGMQDVTYKCSDQLEALLNAGKVTITYGGQTFTNATVLNDYLAAQTPQGFDGEVQITLIGGEFGKGTADWQNITFDVHVHGDNITEHDTMDPYKGGSDLEGISVTLDGVTDTNETKVADNAVTELTGTIVDFSNGAIALGGGQFTAPTSDPGDFGHWSYTLHIGYANDERENDPYTADNPWMNRPGEPVHVKLQITDSEAMQNGEEYAVDAYRLFLSMNGDKAAAAGNPFENVTDVDGYYGELQTLFAAAQANPDYAGMSADDLWRMISDELGLAIVRDPDGSESWDESGANNTNTYDVYAPESAFDANGNISFEIDRGGHGGITGGDGQGFVVEVSAPDSGAMAEVIEVKGEVTAGDPQDIIKMHLTGGTIINEDENMGGAGSNIDTYKVVFENTINNEVGQAAGDISFNLTFTPKSGGLNFDFNLQDNAYLDTWRGSGENGEGVGDVGLFITDADGNQVIYGDKAAMIAALQDQFDREYGDDMVTVNGIDIVGGKIVFNLTAKEGFDLSQGIEIKFQALDDSINDDWESFRVQINNVDTGDKLNVVIEGQREGTTDIRDESSSGNVDYRNGFALSVEESSGYEANLEGMGDGKYVWVTTRAYVLDDNTNQMMDLKTLYGHFLTHSKDSTDISGMTLAELAALANSSADFKVFMADFYAPTQSITVSFNLDGDDATKSQDYVNTSSGTIPPSHWDLVIDADGNIYYEADGSKGHGLQVELIKDHESEGDEAFNLTLTGSDGNESRPCKESDFDNWVGDKPTGTTEVTIIDVHDGPQVISIGPAGGLVMEPIDRDHGYTGNQGSYEEHKADPREVLYKIELSQAAYEDMAVWFNHDGSGATYGEDFIFGEGVYVSEWVGGELKVYALGADGAPDKGNPIDPADLLDGNALKQFEAHAGEGFFVVIEKGQTAVDFPVKILDDNDTTSVDGGVDTGAEDIHLAIDHVVGSEATVEGENGHLIPWDETVAFKYEFGGVQGIVDPVAGTFTTNGGDVYTFGDTVNNPLGLPSAPPTAQGTVTSHDDIQDDMQGPTVSLGLPGRWDSNSDSFEFDVKMPDICQEDVTVTISLYGENIYGGTGGAVNTLATITVTIPAGSPGWDTITLAQLQDALNDPDHELHDHVTVEGTLPNPNQSFYIQISSSLGGETISDNSLTYVDYDSGTSMVLTDLASNSIKEQTPNDQRGADYPEYSFKIGNITDETLDEVHFDIVFRPNSAGADDMNGVNTFTGDGRISIDIPASFLGDHEGKTVEFTVKADENGNPEVYYNAGAAGNPSWVKVPGASASGDMPSACNDDKIEGDESFLAIVNGATGIDNDTAPAETVIEDMTFAKVMLFGPDGQLLTGRYPEGETLEVTAKLIMVNKAGNPVDENGVEIADWENNLENLVIAKPVAALEFDIEYQDGTATYNSDYGGNRVLVIGEDGEATFDVKIYEDMITEGDETFQISLKPKDQGLDGNDDPIYDRPGLVGQIIPDSGPGAEITIEDTINGPWIKVHMASDVTEGSSLTVNFDSWAREGDQIRQVVEQDVTLTFELKAGGGGLVLEDDIQSITYNGVTATFNQESGTIDWSGQNPPFDLVPDGNGGYLIILTMPEGSAMGSFTITPRNDVISETGETFTLQLVETSGSETSIHSTAEGAKTVTIHDDNNGYVASIEPVHGEESGYAGIEVKFAGNNAPEEDVHFEITVDPDKAQMDTGGIIRITLPDGSEVTYDLAPGATGNPAWITWNEGAGKLIMDVPQANMVKSANDTLKVEFPINDNSLAGTDYNFTVGITINGGEITFGATPVFGSGFMSETAAIGNHGGKTMFEVEHADNISLTSVAGDMELTVNGVNPGVVQSITVKLPNGDTVTFDSTEWTASGNSIKLSGLDIGERYEVEITYIKTTDPAELGDIADAKENLTVSGAIVGDGRGVSVNVTDEAQADLDGPSASLVLTDETYITGSAPASVSEEGTVHGKLVVDMDPKAGDPGDTVQELILTVEVKANPDGSYPRFTLDQSLLDEGYTFSQSGGVITVTMPEGVTVPANGIIELPFTVEGMDNKLIVNPDFEITLTTLEGGASTSGQSYEKYEAVDDTHNMALDNEDNPDVTVFTVDAPDISEGGTATFTVTMPAYSGKELGLGDTVTVWVKIDGLESGDVVTGAALDEDPMSPTFGLYAITIIKGSTNTPGTSFTITSADDALASEPRMITVTVKSSDTFEAVDGSRQITVTDEIGINADGLSVTLAAAAATEHVDAGQDLLFTLSLAGMGDYFQNGGALPVDFNFVLDTSGLTDIQLTSLADQLADNGLTVTDNSSNVSGQLLVTVPEGHPVSNAGESIDLAITTSGDNMEPISLGVSDTAVDHHGLETSSVTGSPDEMFVDFNLVGTDGNDIIHGGAGNDIIRGGLGNDELWGGGGEDTFVWEVEDITSSGLDQIMDFSYGDDRLLFDDPGFTVDGIFNGSDTLTIEVTHTDNGASVSQDVIVHFEHNQQFNDFVAEYNTADGALQEQMVADLIKNITGN